MCMYLGGKCRNYGAAAIRNSLRVCTIISPGGFELERQLGPDSFLSSGDLLGP